MPTSSDSSETILYRAPLVNVGRILALVIVSVPALILLGIGVLLLVGDSRNPLLLIVSIPPVLVVCALIVIATRLRFTVSTSGLTIVNYLVTHRFAWDEVQLIRTAQDFFLRGATTVITRDGRAVTAMVTSSNYALWRGESPWDHGSDLRAGGRPAQAAIDAHQRHLRGEFAGTGLTVPARPAASNGDAARPPVD